MNPTRFDEFTKALARTTSRRQALLLIVGTLAGTVLAGCGSSCSSDSDCSGSQTCVNGMCSSSNSSSSSSDTNSSSNSSSSSSGSGCSGSETSCSGTCVDTNTDFNNCGSCGNQCTGSNAGCCNGSCVDRNTDINNCGSCGFACTTGTTPGCCTGVCTDLGSDNNNCGSCGNACSSGSTCMNGSCQAQAQYYIYVIAIEPGGSIVVGTQADVQKPGCDFTDGGLCSGNDPNVQVLSTLGGPYNTQDQAVAAYCSMVTDVHSAFGGTKGYINGQDYWLDNAPSC